MIWAPVPDIALYCIRIKKISVAGYLRYYEGFIFLPLGGNTFGIKELMGSRTKASLGEGLAGGGEADSTPSLSNT